MKWIFTTIHDFLGSLKIDTSITESFSFAACGEERKKYQQVKIKNSHFWNQEVKNYSPWTKPSPLPVCTKFYQRSCSFLLWLPSSYKNRAEPLWKRTDSPQNLKYLLPGPSQKGLMILSLNNAEIQEPRREKENQRITAWEGTRKKRKLIERGGKEVGGNSAAALKRNWKLRLKQIF